MALLSLSACKKSSESPPWAASSSPSLLPSPTDQAAPHLTQASPPPTSPAPLQREFTFLSYNLKNYLKTPVYRQRVKVGEREKPPQEITALARVIQKASPDIIGVCEIGTSADLAHFQQQLAAVGLSYPFSEHVSSFDPTRHLALLSRFPIMQRHSHRELTFKIGSLTYPMKRGILEVCLSIEGFPVRLIGVHLKSKRPSPYQDQARLRRHEAALLRDRLDELFRRNPSEGLLVYGDFNDTYRSPPLSIVKGTARSASALIPLSLTDQNGDFWTYFWKEQRTYSTFDYILVNQALQPFFQKNQSGILSGPDCRVASDHRPLFVTFRGK